MVSDNSFDDTVFSFMDISFNELSAAKLVEDKYVVFNYNSQANDKYNSFPLFATLYKNFILMFFFKIYISKQYNKMYLEFKGVSQNTASTYVPALYNGIETISLNNAKDEIYNQRITIYDSVMISAKYPDSEFSKDVEKLNDLKETNKFANKFLELLNKTNIQEILENGNDLEKYLLLSYLCIYIIYLVLKHFKLNIHLLDSIKHKTFTTLLFFKILSILYCENA